MNDIKVELQEEIKIYNHAIVCVTETGIELFHFTYYYDADIIKLFNIIKKLNITNDKLFKLFYNDKLNNNVKDNIRMLLSTTDDITKIEKIGIYKKINNTYNLLKLKYNESDEVLFNLIKGLIDDIKTL